MRIMQEFGSKAMNDADKLVKMAWNLFCEQFPQALKSINPSNLERYKAAWKVGYYFSLGSQFKAVRQRIDELLEKSE